MTSRVKSLKSLLSGSVCTALIIACVHATPEDIQEEETPHQKEPTVDGDRVPISEELREFLASKKVGALLLVNARGEINIIGLEGRPVEPCGRVDGTEITGDCRLKDIDLLNLKQITIFVSSGSHNCTGMWDGLDLYEVHAGGDRIPGTNPPRRYRYGWVDCHHARTGHKLP